MNRQPEEVRPDFMSMTFGELGDFVVSLGEKPYRAARLFSWMAKGAPLSAMTNLPAAFRQKLAEAGEYRRPAIERKLVSAIDGTVKYLYRMTDGECVESVFMHYEHGTSLCVSSQAGCAMGCRFCASTLNGRARNLTASEILGQAAVTAYDTGERVDGIVLMGIGEPLDNYENVVKFLRILNDKDGIGLGLQDIAPPPPSFSRPLYTAPARFARKGTADPPTEKPRPGIGTRLCSLERVCACFRLTCAPG